MPWPAHKYREMVDTLHWRISLESDHLLEQDFPIKACLQEYDEIVRDYPNNRDKGHEYAYEAVSHDLKDRANEYGVRLDY